MAGKWCRRAATSKCPHDPCFLDPNWTGPLPVFLHKNAEKKRALLKARTDNTKDRQNMQTIRDIKL